MSFFGNSSGGNSGGGGLNITVIDTLDSTSTTDALSADKGRVLNEKVDDAKSDINGVSTTVSRHTGNADIHTTKAEKDKLAGIANNANNYSLPTASTTVLGGVKVDGVTITIASGVIKAKQTTIPSTSRFTTTTETDDTHAFIYKSSIPLLPTDDLDIVYNGKALNDSDWSIVDVGGENVIALNVTEGETVDVNIVSGRIYRGFNSL